MTRRLDRAGRPVTRPRPAVDAPVEGAAAAMGLLAGVVAAGVAALVVVHRVVWWWHLREWERAWRRFAASGPESAR